MAICRLLGASRMQQSLAPKIAQVGRLAPPSYVLLNSFSGGGKEVAVETDEGKKKKRWSFLPRRFQHRRNNSLWRNDPTHFNDIFQSGVGSALIEATHKMNKILENVAHSGLIAQMKEKDESYKVRYEVPGLAKEELKITIDDGVLKIIGEHKEEEGNESDDDFWSAKTYGMYNASLVLPDDANYEEVKAELKDGVLTIVIPKDQTKVKQVKEVQIN